MQYAVLGCIHGNAEALRAVLDDIRRRGIDRVVCLGDIVGLGPEPVECVDLVRDTCFITVRGDHDAAMLEGSEGFIAKVGRALDWTREQLEAAGDPSRLDFLREALDSFASAGIAFHHGSPRSRDEYLYSRDVRADPRKLRAAFALTEKVCFCAHTHVPGVILESPLSWRSAKDLDDYFHYRKGNKALVNVGSVGQPRDGDPRACYLEIQKNEMYWRRVAYPVDKTVNRLAGLEAMSPDLAIRLQKGR
ncbi:MAG: metallophosphoesterase [Planctomycetota bacterium]|nr:MAG: metallophosphoesterase [Planctomycetota bacterium]